MALRGSKPLEAADVDNRILNSGIQHRVSAAMPSARSEKPKPKIGPEPGQCCSDLASTPHSSTERLDPSVAPGAVSAGPGSPDDEPRD